MPDARVLSGYRGRLVLFLLSAFVVFATMYVLYSAIDTVRQLEMIESQRDQWQRPAEVLQALDLRPGNVVVDLGSGAGYFALKLSPIVGRQGQVLAVDIRKLSLSFLWIRALQSQKRNIRVVLGDEDDPRLPLGAVDAVLIANTFHELRDPRVMLGHVSRSLRLGGRLVIIDRGAGRGGSHVHETDRAFVEAELQQAGFEIVASHDHFIDRPGDDPWWLTVARKR
jgi:ubiquinone/menaquinone biosynthesis C-methylase UbiE